MAPDYMSSMREAVASGDVETARKLVQILPKLLALKYDRGEGRTWMHLASEKGQAEMIRWLSGAGLSPDVSDDSGLVPLWLAIEDEGSLEATAALLEVGANPNATCVMGREPLLGNLAAKSNTSGSMLPFVQLLLEHGARPDQADDMCRTPLHNAAGRGDSEMAVLLMSYGANPRALSKTGLDALELAARWGHHDTAAHMRAWLMANDASRAVRQAIDPQAEGGLSPL